MARAQAGRFFAGNPVVFGVAAGLIILFVALGWLYTDAMERRLVAAQALVLDHLGWFYIVSVGIFLLFVLALLLSRFGDVRLGQDHDEPEFGNVTWFAMLFSAGMGIGLLFFSVAEPVHHLLEPPRDVEPGTFEAANQALTVTFFHWGLHAWAIYAVVGMALAYFAFRRGLPLTIRSTLHPLLGDRIHGPIGKAVEVMAVLGTLFGVATSLGLGVMQINAGLDYLGVLEVSKRNQIWLIAGITAIATVSVVTGLKVGIRRLSELNLALGLALVIFVLAVGPTVLLLSSFVQGIGQYLQSLVDLTFRTDAHRGPEWQKSWTMFYWAWWISWSPFVGMFIARISRGRTIREFILGVLLVPTTLTFAWLTIFGATGIRSEMAHVAAGGVLGEGVVGAAGFDTRLFALLSELPLADVAAVVTVIVIATYFVTSSDSASLVIDILVSDGRTETPVATRMFWAVLEGAIAAVLLLAGGLVALQTGAILTALPFCAIMLCICWSLYTALRHEP